MPVMYNLKLIVLFCIANVNCFLLVHENIQRNVTKILTVPNGGGWGNWTTKAFCAPGTYAFGFNLQIEPPQGGGDDTGVNALELQCRSMDFHRAYVVFSGTSPWGDLMTQGYTYCNRRYHDFLTGFSLYVEKNQGSGDDTEVNFVKFKCRDFAAKYDEYDLTFPPGHGVWGSWGPSSQSCGANSAICGLMTRIEEPQGSGDDTALNDVIMYCCT